MSRIEIKKIDEFTLKGKQKYLEDFLLSSIDKGVFAVADGFGGPVAGAEAAETACVSLKKFLEDQAGDLDATLPFVLKNYYSLAGNVVFNSMLYANERVLHKNLGKGIHEKGGCSVIAGVLDQDTFALASAGHCQGWLRREQHIQSLVIPRSYSRFLDSSRQVKSLHHQIPLIAVGIDELLEPEIVEFKVRKGDQVILATDGIYDQFWSREGFSFDFSVDEMKRFFQSDLVDNLAFLKIQF
ncbi:MAG: hypothetical protein CL678_10140 [Bdellovibrionaceae bacterium]|nr:hypothetical protein [Pseudobdellovibrionaceae bacterium]|tara:strand:- start:4532 stop:5254 length:723 start_codon:yes stop_codon:yes gene_type:complete